MPSRYTAASRRTPSSCSSPMVDIMTCDTAIATVRIRAPDTIGTRAVSGHGRCHNVRTRASKTAPISTACFMRLDDRPRSRKRDVFGNPNVRLRTLFVMSNAARALPPELIDMMPSGSLRGRYRTNPSCMADAFFVRRRRVHRVVCLASPCLEVICRSPTSIVGALDRP